MQILQARNHPSSVCLSLAFDGWSGSSTEEQLGPYSGFQVLEGGALVGGLVAYGGEHDKESPTITC